MSKGKYLHVKLKKDDPRGIKAGTEGIVISSRNLKDDPELQYLIKFKRKSGHVAMDASKVEVIGRIDKL